MNSIDEDKLLARLLEKINQDQPSDTTATINSEIKEKIKELKERASRLFYDKPESFKQGAIVVWKEGLKNKKYPEYDEPAYVIKDLLKEPIISPEDESGSTYFQEQLDLVLAILDDDDDFTIFHYDHRRFKVIQPAPEDSSTSQEETTAPES